MLMRIPNRTRGSFIADPVPRASRSRHLIDGDAALAVHHVEAVPDHAVELGEAGGRVVCPLQPADDDQADIVLLDDAPGELRIGRLVEAADVALALLDL